MRFSTKLYLVWFVCLLISWLSIPTTLSFNIVYGISPLVDLTDLSSLLKISALFLTGILGTITVIIFLLSTYGNGFLRHNIDSATYEDWFLHPKQGVDNYFTNTWAITLLLCDSIAFIGSFLSLATGLTAVSGAWVGLSTGLLIYFILLIPYIDEGYITNMEQIQNNLKEISSNVIYAERDIIIRKTNIHIRRGRYAQVFFYDRLQGYGEISPNWVFMKWKNSNPSLIEISKTEVFLKQIDAVLKANSYPSKREDIRSIAPYLFRERRMILLRGVVLSFGTLLLLILIAWWADILPLFF
ncbi:MAG: hypothetical protein ACW976_01985 [Candidatus Ranarchaeia archaeon]|jgi:hypothetical protein